MAMSIPELLQERTLLVVAGSENMQRGLMEDSLRRSRVLQSMSREGDPRGGSVLLG